MTQITILNYIYHLSEEKKMLFLPFSETRVPLRRHHTFDGAFNYANSSLQQHLQQQQQHHQKQQQLNTSSDKENAGSNIRYNISSLPRGQFTTVGGGVIQRDSTAPTFVVIRGSETADDHKSSSSEFPPSKTLISSSQATTAATIQIQPPQQQFVLLQLPSVAANNVLTAQPNIIQEKHQQQQQQPFIPTLVHFARITNNENSLLRQEPQQRRSLDALQPQQSAMGNVMLQQPLQEGHQQQQMGYSNASLRPMQGPIVKKIGGGSKRFTSIR